MTAARRVLAVVPDLFFAAKIAAVAKAAGADVAFASAAAVPALCAAQAPDLVLLDLHAGPEVHALVRALKAGEATRGVPLVGFFSHVDLETRNAAVAAGIDRALPRSAFVARLPELLAGGGSPAGGGA
jgi:CheY-like chemotaxis protein